MAGGFFDARRKEYTGDRKIVRRLQEIQVVDEITKQDGRQLEHDILAAAREIFVFDGTSEFFWSEDDWCTKNYLVPIMRRVLAKHVIKLLADETPRRRSHLVVRDVDQRIIGWWASNCAKARPLTAQARYSLFCSTCEGTAPGIDKFELDIRYLVHGARLE